MISAAKSAFVSRGSPPFGLRLLEVGDLGRRPGREELEVTKDDVVVDLHHFAEHRERLFLEADVVVGALAHLLADDVAPLPLCIGALEERGRHDHLPALSVPGHQVAAEEQVEQLVGPAELDVAREGDRVVCLQERVEELVLVDRLVCEEPLAEIVSLQHPRHGHLRHQLDHLGGRELVEPLRVVANLGRLRVEHLEGLGRVRRGRLHHLLARQARPQIARAGRVTDHRGEVTH